MEFHFERELDSLKQKLLTMASHAEKLANDSMQALTQRDAELAWHVRRNDDVVDQFEVEIDDAAILLLAKAPLASDLRLVKVVMKVSQNLERMGDEATKIAKCACALSQEPPVKIRLNLPQMADLSLAMIKEALDGFAHGDSTAARAIISRDKEVDALNREILQTLIGHMTENPDTIARCLHWIVAAKSLERIADHAKNIAEEVVYLYEAQDIRHALKN
jgi:phosphate transport system protein